MSGFDDPGIFFSDNFGFDSNESSNAAKLSSKDLKRRLMEFIRSFQSDGTFVYREALRRNYTRGYYFLQLEMNDIATYDIELFDLIQNYPNEILPVIEDAARDMVKEVLKSPSEEEMEAESVPLPEEINLDDIADIQVSFSWSSTPLSIRQIKADKMASLVKVSGIIVAASSIRSKAVKLTIQCRNCRSTIPNLNVKPGLEGFPLPRRCTSDQTGQVKCPLDPYFVIPDKCKCIDYQQLKLQELPENVPTGEMPRHLLLYCDRYLTDQVVPGNRVSAVGVFSIRKMMLCTRRTAKLKSNVGIRQPYLRVVGIATDTEDAGRLSDTTFSPAEIEEFKKIGSSPDVYETIARSIAPSIFGLTDVKKAIACLLFGGSRKRLPDGLTRRGDVNLLFLGDPGTAKSQLLKFVERVAPIAVYTSGKGSSAAGLTASVIRDAQSGSFVVEGGAMVLADGGVVCIDEFDKMREDDRVAIHEAMEQQTISIAKAGITTSLNTRCSVLAAANSVFGRWDDLKGDSNIDFMPTILSRFDMIFILKDEFDEERDMTLARHVMGVHMNAPFSNLTEHSAVTPTGELSIPLLKKYISFCRNNIFPRVTVQACERLKNQYCLIRSGAFAYEQELGKRLNVTITVRQLEALIRISEALAKMRLSSVATEDDVNEALRLFTVSTYTAAVSGKLAGVESLTSREELEELTRIEKQIKKRFVIGSQVSENAIIQDLLKQKYSERLIYKVIHTMIRRGEIQHRLQRKLLIRLK